MKFRVWDKLQGQWRADIKFIYLDSDGDLCWKLNKMDPEENIISWYTGYKDRKGCLIYDGDIIRGFYSGNSYLGMACLVECSIGQPIRSLNLDEECSIFHPSNCEVIGNIYENKNLLLIE
jgi:hypothetical protein